MKDLIPQCQPLAEYETLADEINEAVLSVLRSGGYILGDEVAHFEKEFGAFLGARHCIGVGSGTDAIEMALRALELDRQDLVFAPSHTATATVAAIERAGATPFLVDIEKKSYTMAPGLLEAAIKQSERGDLSREFRARAVIPVHLYGHPADMPSIMEIASKSGLRVVEDCAQAHGASIDGKKVGTWGEMGAFSFYPTKNLGAVGDGGAVVTDDPGLAEKLLRLRQYGWNKSRESDFPGINSRLDEVQAAVLRIKLRHLRENNRKRISIANRYRQKISNDIFSLPHTNSPRFVHVFHQFVVQTKGRDLLVQFLANNNIGTAVHYPKPVHLHPAYRNRFGQYPETLSVTEAVSKKILSLPMYPEMTSQQVDHVCHVLNSFTYPFDA